MTVMARGTAAPTPYTEAFYEGQQDGSVKSAQVVVPIVLSAGASADLASDWTAILDISVLSSP